jgi:V8-like Glu-specific endopeptidase
MSSATNAETVFAKAEIYSGQSVIAFSPSDEQGGDDWALVRLDRRVPNHRVARLRRTGKVAQGQRLHVIGFPNGLPLKFAGNAQVRDNDPAAYFVADLDGFNGNSGSPVFNSDTHEVEGLFVRNGPDFELVGPCKRTFLCSGMGCVLPDCTRVTLFAQHVPLIE